jgi:hypothetical protein
MCCLSEACTSTGKVKAGSRGGGGDRPGVSILEHMLLIIADKAKASGEDIKRMSLWTVCGERQRDKVFDSLSSFYKELLVKKVQINKDGFADRRGVCSGMRVSVLSEHNISIPVISTITPTC